MKQKQILSEEQIGRILDRITYELIERCPPPEELGLLGIRTRGVAIAERLKERVEKICGVSVPGGVVDITLYRDDLERIAPNPVVHATEIDFDITGRTIILVDDVLYTGRTTRAALDQLMDFGRPQKVVLVVLVDRPGRDLPIQADFVGKTIPLLDSDELVEVHMKEIDGEDGVYIDGYD